MNNLVKKTAHLAVLTGIAFAITSVGIPDRANANSKYAGIVIDVNTGKTLYADNADSTRYPASLTKIMTLYLLFEQLESGRVTLNTKMKVSKRAAGQAPSKLGLKPGSYIRVKDAIRALVTKSANDVAVVIAEHIGGTEIKFAKRMTKKARKIGMKRTEFRNANGLPNKSQHTSARDMAKLGISIQKRFPSYYKYFSTRSFTYKGRKYRNHNRLLGKVQGVDGIKTGYTRASGFNLVTSVKRSNKHIVAVVMGGCTGKSRDAHMKDLIKRYLKKAKAKRRGKGKAMATTSGQLIPMPKSRTFALAS
ncbi:MAG: D-alanyl-D-alanine carboxypeptidase, partial [Rhizobiales bacterium]|nr:D-alanyl-D-alanine carboxypeptidase [Hyphomicrobiales bacterium]